MSDGHRVPKCILRIITVSERKLVLEIKVGSSSGYETLLLSPIDVELEVM